MIEIANDPLSKVIAAAGFLGEDHDQMALIIIEPLPLQDEQLQKFIQDAQLELELHNDAYSSFSATGSATYQLQLTYPATDQHINKHLQQNYHRIIETPQVYLKSVKCRFLSVNKVH